MIEDPWDKIFGEDVLKITVPPQQAVSLKENRMKILTMCQGGNSRSVACAFLLKYKYDIDALACGWERNSDDTRRMLIEWADYVIVMQSDFIGYIPGEYHHKLFSVDVGPDKWCNGLHPDLLETIDKFLPSVLQTIKESHFTTNDKRSVR